MAALLGVIGVVVGSPGPAGADEVSVAVEDVHAFGASRFYGSTGSIALVEPVVGILAHPGGHGYYEVARDGGLFAFGEAPFLGSLGDISLVEPIVAGTVRPDGAAYWLLAADGGVFSFPRGAGTPFFGSAVGLTDGSPAVGIAATASGKGYFIVTAAGKVLTFGDAVHRGDLTDLGITPVAPIVGMAADPDGEGYWLVASDGGVFAFSAPFHGSMGGRFLAAPIVGMTAHPTPGRGYWFVASDGGMFAFGPGAAFHGSAQPVVGPDPAVVAVGMAAHPSGAGYWVVVRRDGPPRSSGPPTILRHPSDRTVWAGQPVTLSVDAHGPIFLSYQWLKDGVPVPGATRAVLTIPATTVGDSGTYSVRVRSSRTGSVTSRAATVTVKGPPVIVQGPADTAVREGSGTTLTATVTGATGLRWQRDTGSGFVDVPGATGATYDVPAADLTPGTDGVRYRVVATNPAGSVASDPATVDVIQWPYSDGFPTGSTAATFGAWWEVTNPGGDPLPVAEGGSARFVLPENVPNNLAPGEDQAPRILQARGSLAPRDLSLEAALPVPAARDATTGAGILIVGDDTGAGPALLRAAVENDGDSYLARLVMVVDGSLTIPATTTLASSDNPPPDPVLVQLIQSGSSWSMRVSTDGGTTYTDVGSALFERAGTPVPVLRAGLAAVSVGRPELRNGKSKKLAMVAPDADLRVGWFRNLKDVNTPVPADGPDTVPPAIGLVSPACAAPCAGSALTFPRTQALAVVTGRVTDDRGTAAIASLEWRFAGDPTFTPLTIGPDRYRLARTGDFTIEIPIGPAGVEVGTTRTVEIRAADTAGNSSTTTVDVTVVAAPTASFTADWDGGAIGTVASVVDGDWQVTADGELVTTHVGYDRLVALGDPGLTDYTVTATFTVEGLDWAGKYCRTTGPVADRLPSCGPGVGLLVRWTGHSDDGFQPRHDPTPYGALGFYRWKFSPDGSATTATFDGMQLIGGADNQQKAAHNYAGAGPTPVLQLGSPYTVRLTASGSTYTFKMWPGGPADEPPDDPTPDVGNVLTWTDAGGTTNAAGSVLVVAHHVRVRFSDVTVTVLP